MTYKESIEHFRESATLGVSIDYHPNNHSVDNALLFTATHLVIAKEEYSFEDYNQELNWFRSFIKRHEILPGLLLQYPLDLGGSTNYTAFDCYHCAAVHSTIAANIWSYGEAHGWLFNNNKPSEFQWGLWWRYRPPGFKEFIKACTGRSLHFWDQIKAGSQFIGDVFSPKDETNGRCQLVLRASILKTKGLIIRNIINFWAKRMDVMYPKGVSEMRALYFKDSRHPFQTFGNKKFIDL